MINGYTESEICMLYREAKNKALQIEILTQLTGLRTFEVIRILEEGGYVVADLEKLKELHAEGLSIKAIGVELGIGQSTVNYHMKRLGLEPNGKGRKKKEDVPVDEKAVQKLKEETQRNIEELKEILPKAIPDPEDLPIPYDALPEVTAEAIETLTPQQYYELAKLTLELLKTIWEG